MLYENYTNRIKNIVAENRQRKNLSKGFDFPGLQSTPVNKKQLIHEQKIFSDHVHLNTQPLGAILKTSDLSDEKVGLHPDFKHLKGTDGTEFHYIVSVFIDIQGSTNLFKEYELEDIFRITNTIQSAAIHTCVSIGGHVQRLQGDGVFAYFGGKTIEKKKAVEMAATACSMITYFVKNDLKNVFLEEGVEDIKTRIGIDFGDDADVLWANFGLLNVSELTTLSLHTSLASKMQSWAKPNGIVAGQNFKDLLETKDDFFDLVRNSKGEVEKRYIFENDKKSFRYAQYAFDWFNYLKSLPFIRQDDGGALHIINEQDRERERLNRLRNTSSLLQGGNAFLNRSGQISAMDGVHHEHHRFHYGK